MQLLDSCPLPQAQFASLSILLQLHLNHDDNDGSKNPSNNMDISEEGVGGDTANDMEADKSAGPASKSHTSTLFQPQYAVLKESLTVISPTTILPEGACNRSMDSLQCHVMKNYGMRDDFIGLNNSDSNTPDQFDDGNGSIGEEEDDDGSPRRSSKVRFHDDTKEGVSTEPTNNAKDGNISNSNGNQLLSVQTFKPPPQQLNCSLGVTLFYIAMDVKDIVKGVGDDAVKTFHNCAKVLLPDISLQELNKAGNLGKNRGQQGVILLTVGIIGPAYDLFGCSSVISNLPARLLESMSTFGKLDTSPKEVVLASAVVNEQRQVMENGKKKNLRRGKNAPLSVTTQQTQQKVSYDSAYFQCLYMALLATLIDEDGMLHDHDDIIGSTTTGVVSESTLFASTTAVVGVGLNTPSSGTANKKKRFTFSRGNKGNKTPDYESGDLISGGDDPFELEKGATVGLDETSGMNNAEIVRRTAQQLEVLSLVEDDMPLPKYTHFAEGRVPASPRGGLKSPRGRHKVPSGRFGRLPVVSDLAGFEYRPPLHQQQHMHGGVMSLSGTVSTSVVGNSDDVSTATGGADSSKYTLGTMGSEFSSLSSVPTLSKSKRDSSGSSSRSRFMRKKKRSSPAKISEDTESQQEAKAKPPLHPQDSPSKPVYVPFSVDDAIEEDVVVQTSNATIDSPSIASVSTKDTVEEISTASQTQEIASAPPSPATPQQQPPSPATPQQQEEEDDDEEELTEKQQPDPPQDVPQPKPPIITAMSRSFSEDESAEENQSIPEISPPTPKEVEEPTVYLDVGLALNEDLTCEYKRSKLSSLAVEGTVQVRTKTTYNDESSAQNQQETPVPFFLHFLDPSGHIKALQENKKFVQNVNVANREFIYTINVPREEEYFPVVRYKCGSSLNPVPIVSYLLCLFCIILITCSVIAVY